MKSAKVVNCWRFGSFYFVSICVYICGYVWVQAGTHKLSCLHTLFTQKTLILKNAMVLPTALMNPHIAGSAGNLLFICLQIIWSSIDTVTGFTRGDILLQHLSCWLFLCHLLGSSFNFRFDIFQTSWLCQPVCWVFWSFVDPSVPLWYLEKILETDWSWCGICCYKLRVIKYEKVVRCICLIMLS